MIAAALAACAVLGGAVLHWNRGDRPDPQVVDAMNASWARARQTGVLLQRVAPSELAEALASTRLRPEQVSELTASVKNGETSLVWLTLWDSLSEDGDVATVEADGLRVVVPLLNRKTRVAVPRPAGGVLKVTASKDGGGGGVTVGIMAGSEEVFVSPMAEGETIGIPVR
jgi:hypothetical protein